MHPHFLKEEEYALPPLGLLGDLSRGVMASGATDVLVLTDKLTLHAQTEEEVMYPAAILIGEYVRIKTDSA